MAAIEASGVSFRYGRGVLALDEVSLHVPEGAFYALVGANGAGKTTLMQILRGLRRPSAGEVRLLGSDVSGLSPNELGEIGYVAEGMSLPLGLRLTELEQYVAPFYLGWDTAFADDLRRRFRLDPQRRIGEMSRGERMKSAILCALAPRPRLLFLDEPFTGLDVVVKDELISGLLDSAQSEGWTGMICSHDISEMEMLADWVGVLEGGRMKLSAPMDEVRERFVRVDATLQESPGFAIERGDSTRLEVTSAPPGPGTGVTAAVAAKARASGLTGDPRWVSLRTLGSRVGGIVDLGAAAGGPEVRVQLSMPAATRLDVRPASLREIITALIISEPHATASEEIGV